MIILLYLIRRNHVSVQMMNNHFGIKSFKFVCLFVLCGGVGVEGVCVGGCEGGVGVGVWVWVCVWGCGGVRVKQTNKTF